MYKDILRAIVGIEIFPVLSLVIFLAVFLVMLVWVLRMDRGTLARHASLPLQEDVHPAAAQVPVRRGQA